MPLEPVLGESQLAEYQRNTIKMAFNDRKFKWIMPDCSHEYETEDGIHLLEKSVLEYFEYLNAKIKSRQCK